MNLFRFGNFAGNLANAGRRIINGEVQFLPDLQTAGEHRGPIDPLIDGAGRNSCAYRFHLREFRLIC